jgi:hypothetical protein
VSRARFHFENALDEAQRLGDTELEGCARGFLGLVHHLTGDFGSAQAMYAPAIDAAVASGNRRALSIFRRHLADLKRRLGRLSEARADLDESLIAARSGRHPDLVHYARAAQVNLELADPDHNRSLGHESLETTIEFARTVGIPKLEADAIKVQAHVALSRGNTILSRRLALGALQIAVGSGMSLRVTAAMCLLGRVARMRGNWDSAKRFLMTAVETGQRQGYLLQVQDAEHELLRIAAWDQGY